MKFKYIGLESFYGRLLVEVKMYIFLLVLCIIEMYFINFRFFIND